MFGAECRSRAIKAQNKAIGTTALEAKMNGLIYLVGLVVVIMFILSFLGLR
jgi:hypothetical protein